jgi:hypothetical protein
MQAILISEDNVLKIYFSNGNLQEFTVKSLVAEHSGTQKHYFIPSYSSDPAQFSSWAIFPESFLKDYYTYDERKIKTEFVEITPK